MEEMLPIASGLVLGGLLAATRVLLSVRLALVVILAVSATVASGEFRLSWGFLLPDVAEVAASCAAAFFVAKAWQRYASKQH